MSFTYLPDNDWRKDFEEKLKGERTMELNIKYTIYIKYSCEMKIYGDWRKHTYCVPVPIENFDAFLHDELAELKKLSEQPLKNIFDSRNGTFRNIQIVGFYITADSDVVSIDPALMISEKGN